MRHVWRNPCLFKELSSSDISSRKAVSLHNSEGHHFHPSLGAWHLPSPAVGYCTACATVMWPHYLGLLPLSYHKRLVTLLSVFQTWLFCYRKQKEKQTTVKPLLLDRDWEQVYITKGDEGKAGGQGSGHELWLLPEWKHSYQSQCWYQ